MNVMNATAADWTHIEPLLDEAMHALDDIDRAAVLLRYFENKSLREVGQALGASENAAQKRLTRAVEQLREYFSQRGVSVGASGLVAFIGTNAVQAAPVGLAVTISAAVLLTEATLIAAGTIAAKAIAMTTLQKTLTGATLALFIGLGVYQARKVAHLEEQLKLLSQRQQSPPTDSSELLEQDTAVAKSKSGADGQARLSVEHAELLRLRGEVSQLRRQAAERDQPKVASQSTDAALPLAPTTEAEYELLQRQMTAAMSRVESALRRFITNNPYGSLVDANGQPNAQIFADTPGLPLNNLEIQTKDIQSLARAFDEKSRAILVATKTPIYYNSHYIRFYLLADGTVRSDFSYSSDQQFKVVYPSDEDLAVMRQRALEDGSIPENLSALRKTLEPVAKAFLAANDGRGPLDLAELWTFVNTPAQQAALQQLLQLRQSSGRDNPSR